MPTHEAYRRQVELLMRILSFVAEERCFARKGGTAINFFLRNLPRLSVDIDLTFLPVEDRTRSLKNIDDAMKRIVERVEASMPGAVIQPTTRKNETPSLSSSSGETAPRSKSK